MNNTYKKPCQNYYMQLVAVPISRFQGDLTAMERERERERERALEIDSGCHTTNK